jgi:hypothetical protein
MDDEERDLLELSTCLARHLSFIGDLDSIYLHLSMKVRPSVCVFTHPYTSLTLSSSFLIEHRMSFGSFMSSTSPL